MALTLSTAYTLPGNRPEASLATSAGKETRVPGADMRTCHFAVGPPRPATWLSRRCTAHASERWSAFPDGLRARERQAPEVRHPLRL